MTELVVVRAADEGALVKEMSRLIEFLDRVPDVQLVDVAYTWNEDRYLLLRCKSGRCRRVRW